MSESEKERKVFSLILNNPYLPFTHLKKEKKKALELFYGLKSDGLCALKMVSVPVVQEGKKLNTSPCKYLFFPTLAAVLHGMKPAEDFFDTTVAFLDKPTL